MMGTLELPNIPVILAYLYHQTLEEHTSHLQKLQHGHDSNAQHCHDNNDHYDR